MRNRFLGLKLCGLFVAALTVLNCGGAHPKSGVALTPLAQAQKDFLENYQFLVTKSDKKELDKCQSVEDVQKFTENFWKIRDTDPNTPENECKARIDERIGEIKNEILLRDVNTFGVSFAHNGGLNGEMARVYILYGMPEYKLRLPSGKTYAEMLLWLYGDENEHVLFRFLFYRKYGKFILFKNHNPFIGAALKEISNGNPLSPQYIQMVWNELSMNDIGSNFRDALIQFSDYSNITIGNAIKPPRTGSNQKIYDKMLKPSTDSASTSAVSSVPNGSPQADSANPVSPKQIGAKEPQTQKSGQTQTAKQILFSKFNSSIPGRFNLVASGEHKIAFYLFLRFRDLDWEIINDSAECVLNLEIDFKNRETEETIIFVSATPLAVPKDKAGSEDIFVIFSNKMLLAKPGSEDSQETAEEMINKELPDGNYTAKAFLTNSITGKYAVWQEEINK